MSASRVPSEQTNASDELILHLTDQNFDENTKEGFVLVDFWATWCTPCRAIAPIVEKLAEKYNGKLKVGKLDTDENPLTSNRFGIMSIPLVVLFKDGQPVDSILGARPEQFYDQMIKKNIPELE
ncbi:MAG: thioredoxin [Ignavibacteriaceae bacterium]|nr:thioredoxin [Ignavibacteriaceae bacterium]